MSFKHDRPTIGILAGRSILEGTPRDHYRTSILRGIRSAARIKQCHIVVSWGIRTAVEANEMYPSWPTVSPKSDFIPVGPWNMDGLIVFSPLGNEDRSLYLQKLIAEDYPVLFIATGEHGALVAVDNKTGMRQAMAHLAEHGHRHIAFIAGTPTDKGDSEARLKAYYAAVAEYHLEADPRLVEWSWHIFSGGYQAMQRLLASGIKFSAVMVSNDNAAAGAMKAIQEAGLRIPADIAIIGFDDQPIATAQVPPLSSVHVPLALIGEQALVSMLEHLIQQTTLQSVQIPTHLVRRLSCGCMPEAVSSAIDETPRMQSVSLRGDQKRASIQEKKQQLVNEMLNVLPAELRFPGEDEIRNTCTTLIEAFYKSLDEINPGYFQTAFVNCIHELERADGNIEPWQEMISALRREMTLLPLQWKRNEIRSLAEGLLHQARAAAGESAQRQDKRHEYPRVMKALALNSLTAHLSAALSEGQMVGILNEHLAEVGIRHARVMLFEAEQGDPVAWSLAINADVDAAPQRFLSRQFPPPGFYPADELLNVILLPLVFQNQVFGYVAFDTISDLGACAVIATQLAATIKVARLHAQVVELSLTDALTGLHNRRSFELFLKNEISRSQRFSHSLAVIFIDIDNFKEYNDSYGHPAGDEALQQVAKCLSAGRRVADIVARIGGDEFVMILPGSDVDGALKVSRRVRNAVSALSGLKRPISVSMGLTAPGNPEMEAELTIQQADQALYESKRMGKNRISVFENARVLDEKEFPTLE